MKLTPAAFVLFFLCRGDRRAAGTAALSFAACTAAGFVLDWHDSVRYWTSIVFQTTRPGSLLFAANQSIQGVLARAGLDPHTGRDGYMAGALRRRPGAGLVRHAAGPRRVGGRLGAVAERVRRVADIADLVVAPLGMGRARAAPARGPRPTGPAPRRAGGGAAGLAVFAAGPQWWFPHTENRESHWAAWEQVIGSSYVIFAAVILLIATCGNPVSRYRALRAL